MDRGGTCGPRNPWPRGVWIPERGARARFGRIRLCPMRRIDAARSDKRSPGVFRSRLGISTNFPRNSIRIASRCVACRVLRYRCEYSGWHFRNFHDHGEFDRGNLIVKLRLEASRRVALHRVACRATIHGELSSARDPMNFPRRGRNIPTKTRFRWSPILGRTPVAFQAEIYYGDFRGLPTVIS